MAIYIKITNTRFYPLIDFIQRYNRLRNSKVAVSETIIRVLS
jgi:hypothetical protein